MNLVSNGFMKLAQTTSILQADFLHFGYPDKALFSNFSASIPPQITLIRGGDGCGKSTLLKLLAASLPLQSGQLHINGISLQKQPESYTAQVFLADPHTASFDQFTVPDYFKLQRSIHAGFNDSVLAEITDGLGLEEHLHKQLFMLSTGTKRKVFLAAALASGAQVTLFDDPFAALDAASIKFVLGWLDAAASASNRAWVIASHVAPDGLRLAQIIDLGD